MEDRLNMNYFFLFSADEIVGASVSIRDRDDILQIWNNRSEEASEAKVRRKFTIQRIYFKSIALQTSLVYRFWAILYLKDKRANCKNLTYRTK